jgi:parallel beta-helix repeat protein
MPYFIPIISQEIIMKTENISKATNEETEAPDAPETEIKAFRIITAVSILLAFGAQAASASGLTYIVGTCTSGTQFKTIHSALNASPAPSTVEVCPGQYAEQITITRPVTLEGITAGNGAMAQIILPDNYGVNASLNVQGSPVPAVVQIYVNNVTDGAVNLSNLDVNGMGFGFNDATFVAVAYQQSSGTVDHLVTSSQDTNSLGSNGIVNGWGMWILGGSSKPSVTVENSSFNSFNGGGIYTSIDTDTTAPELTVTIKNNSFNAVYEGLFSISVDEGADATVSGNFTSGGRIGILDESSKGSITGNTILGSQLGILLASDGPSVTSNNILGTIQEGIDVSVSTLNVSKIESNTIKTVKSPGEIDSTGTGIGLNCNDISSSHVNSNVLMDLYYGYGDAPAGFAGSNTYLSVPSKVSTCTNPSVRSQGRAADRLKLLQQLPGHQH